MARTHGTLRAALKATADGCAAATILPFAALSALERRFRPGSERAYRFCTDTLALIPGFPGVFMRRAFYRLALDACHPECFVGFGAIFTHRQVIVERGVYLGTWALVGSSHLREGTSIGSRASLLSGTDLHEYRDGQWTPSDHGKLRQIVLGPHAMVGEGAIVMADVGEGAMVAAGAVAASKVPGHVVVAGNPARFVRHLAAARADGPSDATASR